MSTRAVALLSCRIPGKAPASAVLLGFVTGVLANASCRGDDPTPEAPRVAVSTQAQTTRADVLLVVGDATLSADDRIVRDRLAGRGWTVEVKDDDVVVAADGEARRLIVVSETSLSAKITDKFTPVASPVMTLEPAIADDLGMTAGNWQVDFGEVIGATQLSILEPSHPLAAGRAGTLTVASGTTKFHWYQPGANAVRAVALASDPGKAAVFGYEAGKTMVSGVAPARRVGFFAGSPTPSSLTEDGWLLFDAAVTWATRSRESLLVAAARPLPAADEVLRARTESLGFGVHVRTGAEVQASHCAGKAVVVISESTESATVDDRLRDIPVPTVSLEPALFDEMGMTGLTWLTHYGVVENQTRIQIVSPQHALAAGYTGTLTVASSLAKLSWGVPAASATVVATAVVQTPGSSVPASQAAVIFSYPKGASMVGLSAPARRVGWMAGHPAATALNNAGLALFDAAVLWAADPATDCSSTNSNGLACTAPNGCDTGTCQQGVCQLAAPSPACNLVPRLGCVYEPSPGVLRAIFGYSNTTSPGQNLSLPPGTQAATGNNFLTGGTSAIAQPTWFQAGDHPVAFTVDLAPGQRVTWNLGKKSVTATGAVSSTAECTVNNSGGEGPVLVVDGTSHLIAPDVARIAPSRILPTGDGLGPIAGTYEVTPNGEATYSLPLAVLPGINGLTPEVSLNYASGAGNGLLGVGWSVAGLSSITRCPKTFRMNGEPRQVTFSSVGTGNAGDDQACLDGVPMLRDGDVFRTKIENFSKIEQLIDANNEPYWKVWARDGRVLTYEHKGSRARPKLFDGSLAPNQVIVAWPISKIEDRFGNKIEFEYEYDVPADAPIGGDGPSILDRRPTRITYGVKREIRFHYVARPAHDYQESFVSGVRLMTTKLLDRVEIVGPDGTAVPRVYKQYRLTYAANPDNVTDWTNRPGAKSITGRSLLEKVEECDGAGRCKPPLNFEWERGSWQFERNEVAGPAPPILSFADVNVDGRIDVITGEVDTGDFICSRVPNPVVTLETRREVFARCGVIDRDDILLQRSICELASQPCFATTRWARYQYALNTSSSAGGFTARLAGAVDLTANTHFSTFAETVRTLPSPLVENLNGSQTPEVVFVDSFAVPGAGPVFYFGTWSLGGGLQSGLDDPIRPTVLGVPPLSISIADTNGDGTLELIKPYSLAVNWGSYAGGIGLPVYLGPVVGAQSDPEQGAAMDLDGAGVATLYTWTNDGTPGVRSHPFLHVLHRVPYFADLNGDGLLDAVDRGTASATSKKIFLGSGRGVAREQLAPLPAFADLDVAAESRQDYGVRSADFDMDGKADFVVFRFANSAEANFLKGNSFRRMNLASASAMSPNVTGGTAERGGHIVDFDGDGLPDIVRQEGNTLVVYRRTGRRPDMLTKVRRGVGTATSGVIFSDTEFRYASIIDPAVYTPVNCAAPAGAPPCNEAQQDIMRSGMWVVREVETDAATSSTLDKRRFSYTYEDGRRDRKSGRFLASANSTPWTQAAMRARRSSTTWGAMGTLARPSQSLTRRPGLGS